MTVDDIVGLLREVHISGLVRSSNVVIPCPFAAAAGSTHRSAVDHHPSLGIKPDDDGGTWNCFTCGRRGSIRSFFLELEIELGVNCAEVLSRLDKLLERDPEEIAASIPDYNQHFKAPEVPYAVFPEAWLSAYAGKVPRYILDRGVELETCKAWGVGFDRISARVFFPVRDDGRRLVGAVGGAIHKVPGKPKYKNYWHRIHQRCGWPLDHKDGAYYCLSCNNQKVEVKDALDGFKKSRFLYGEWMFPKGATPVLVEGIVDTLKVYQAVKGWKKDEYFPLGLLGASPTKEQANKIIRLAGDKVVSFLDNDAAGKEGDQYLRNLLLRRARFFRAVYPEGPTDPGEMTSDQIRAAIRDSRIHFS